MSTNRIGMNNNLEVPSKSFEEEEEEEVRGSILVTTTTKDYRKKKKRGLLSSFRRSKKDKEKYLRQRPTPPTELDVEVVQNTSGCVGMATESPVKAYIPRKTPLLSNANKQNSIDCSSVDENQAKSTDSSPTKETPEIHEHTEYTFTMTTTEEIVQSNDVVVKTTKEMLTQEECSKNDSSTESSWKLKKQVIEAHGHLSSCSESSRPPSPAKSKSKRIQPMAKPTHSCKIQLLSGEHLAPRDRNGLSDPYVKFKYGGRTIHKSKVVKASLNPKWGEHFTINVNSNEKIVIRVYDRDTLSSDDFMGSTALYLDRIPLYERKEIRLCLEDDENDEEELGSIHIAVVMELMMHSNNNSIDKISPMSETNIDLPDGPLIKERLHKLERSDSTISKQTITSIESRSRYARGMPVATATIQLISGKELPACDSNGFSDPYVKLQLGKQRYRSKVCPKTLNPVWQEEFIFNMLAKDSIDRDMAMLDIAVYDKDNYRRDDFIGRCELDLWSLDFDITHSCELKLIDAPGTVLLLVTVHSVNPPERPIGILELEQLQNQYSVFSSFNDLSDIGFLEVKVLSASGLRAADIGGKSDPFCVVDMCNARAQTHTCYKTLDPEWNRTYTFPIKDIHEVVEFTVYDEDKDQVREFLGKIAIPLLSVSNGQSKTYALKDKKLRTKSKGTITLALNVFYNPVRASIRTFTPREDKYMSSASKFKTGLLRQHFSRVWRCIQAILSTMEFINSCFTWKHPVRSTLAFLAYLLIVWNFEIYLIPIALLMLLMKNYFDLGSEEKKICVAQESFADDDEDESEEKLGLMQKLNAIQEVLGKVQNTLDWIASLLERIGGTFTWRESFLSWLAVAVLIAVTIILYFIPLRTIALLWGINKFTKRLRKPNYIPNNELLDFLSRVPSNVEMEQYQQLSIIPDSPKNSKKRK